MNEDPELAEYGNVEAVALVYDSDGKLIRKLATRCVDLGKWELAEPYTPREGEHLFVGMSGGPGATLHRVKIPGVE